MTARSGLRRTVGAVILICITAALPFSTPTCAATSSFRFPRANAVWAYDPRNASGQLEPGTFVHAINHYNLMADAGHRIREIYSYGGNLKMSCPGNQGSRCTAADLHVYYPRTHRVPGHGNSNASTYAYNMGIRSNLVTGHALIVPVIDGSMYNSRSIRGFSGLSIGLARQYADKVAHKLCADPYVSGVEFDLEPLRLQKLSPQFYFYLRIAKDFASARTGCVDRNHPTGRFFAIFGSANDAKPGTARSVHLTKVLNAYHNGYLIDALYDLSSAPAGYRISIKKYRYLADTQAYNMVRWANRLDIRFQFAIPASASVHEYEGCSGSVCRGAPRPRRGQRGYVITAEKAIDASYARQDSLFQGTAAWCFTRKIHYGNSTFTPTTVSGSIEYYLSGVL